MPDTPQVDHVPEDQPLPTKEPQPKLETPVIQMRDVAHDPSPETRVTNAGVRVEPRFDRDDERDFKKEHDAAIEALEEFEKQLRSQPPG